MLLYDVVHFHTVHAWHNLPINLCVIVLNLELYFKNQPVVHSVECFRRIHKTHNTLLASLGSHQSSIPIRIQKGPLQVAA